ncbi:MAG: type II secretion system protein [Betaproteobacteria bacterium]|nr:type II secretion system protein [Betaproteobacteria bacterium]
MRSERSSSKPRPGSFTDAGGRACRGASLVEVVVFIVVVSAAVAGLLGVLGAVSKSSADPVVRKQALAAAESLLEEILARDFVNPSGGYSGAATQANRSEFDDVGDYNGFASVGVYALGGTAPVSGLENYRVQASVSAPAAAFSGVPSGDWLQVTVSVAAPTNESYDLTGYRFRYQFP